MSEQKDVQAILPGERAAICQWIEETFGEETEIMLADGLEAAFLGVGQQYRAPPVAVYDADACIELMMERDGMSFEEATEYFEFNIAGAYVGEQTPLFVMRRPKADPSLP